jgi:hypothetical protein
VDDFIQSADGVALAQAFARIKDSKVRRRILELVRTLAAEEAEAAAPRLRPDSSFDRTGLAFRAYGL